MNERILQLARQAANGMLSFDAEGEWRLSEKEVEKFAELIVKQCISMADEFEMDVNRSGLVDNMKEYFGIE